MMLRDLVRPRGVPWLALLTLALLPACATARAKPATDQPALVIPPPPPRVIEAPDTETPPPVPLPEERHPSAPPRKPAQPPPQPKTEAPKPAEQAPPPAPTEPPKIEEPAKPATTLQTAPPEKEGETERAIVGLLTRASADLNRIDYRALDAPARTQYDTAKRFVTQAQDALRAKNLVFARTVADKAATLAAQLAGK